MSPLDDIEARLTAAFCCTKCRGKAAVTRRVQLTRSLPELLGLTHGKYVLLTCTLCGYTEIFDPAVYVADAEEIEAANRIATKVGETL